MSSNEAASTALFKVDPRADGLADEYAALVTFGGGVGTALIPPAMSERVIAALRTLGRQGFIDGKTIYDAPGDSKGMIKEDSWQYGWVASGLAEPDEARAVMRGMLEVLHDITGLGALSDAVIAEDWRRNRRPEAEVIMHARAFLGKA